MTEDTTPAGEDAILSQPRITVFGDRQCRLQRRRQSRETGMNGVRFVGVSTHARLMAQTEIPEKLLLAGKLRRGLGPGAIPSRGASRPKPIGRVARFVKARMW
jgi:cell division GTPase FtsZ